MKFFVYYATDTHIALATEMSAEESAAVPEVATQKCILELG